MRARVPAVNINGERVARSLSEANERDLQVGTCRLFHFVLLRS